MEIWFKVLEIHWSKCVRALRFTVSIEEDMRCKLAQNVFQYQLKNLSRVTERFFSVTDASDDAFDITTFSIFCFVVEEERDDVFVPCPTSEHGS